MYLSKEQLENIANDLNATYFPFRLQEATPLDPYDLIDKLNMQIEWKYISPDESILGISFFADGL